MDVEEVFVAIQKIMKRQGIREVVIHRTEVYVDGLPLQTFRAIEKKAIKQREGG